MCLCGGNCHISDVDECTITGSSTCDQICINTIGSFNCSCSAGFSLNSDMVHCDGKIRTYMLSSSMGTDLHSVLQTLTNVRWWTRVIPTLPAPTPMVVSCASATRATVAMDLFVPVSSPIMVVCGQCLVMINVTRYR